MQGSPATARRNGDLIGRGERRRPQRSGEEDEEDKEGGVGEGVVGIVK